MLVTWGATRGTAAPLAPVTGPDLLDRFDTASTALDGTAPEPYAGFTNRALKSGSGVTAVPSISPAGQLINGALNANNRNTSFWETPGVTIESREHLIVFEPTGFDKIGTASETLYLDLGMTIVTPGSSWARIRIRYDGSANGGSFLANAPAFTTSGAISAAGTTIGAWTGDGNAFAIMRGDTVTLRLRKSGSVVNLDLDCNGWPIATGPDVNALASYTLTNTVGIGAASSSTACKITEISSNATASQSAIKFKHQGHIAQYAFWDTDTTAVNINTTILWTGARAPAAGELTYTIWDVTTGTETAVAALTDLTLSFVNNGDGSLSVRNLLLPSSAGIPARFYMKVKWANVTINGTPNRAIFAPSPVLMPGEIVAPYGQSRTAKLWQTLNTGITYTDPLYTGTIDGSIESPGPTIDLNRRWAPSSTTTTRPNVNTGAMWTCNVAAGLFGHTRLQYIRAGFGGKDAIDRQVGSTYWTALIDQGIPRSSDVGVLMFGDHAYEISNSNGNWPATWNAASETQWIDIICDEVEATEAAVGHRVLVVVQPHMCQNLGAYYANAAAFRHNLFMRTLKKICEQNGDGRFASSPYGSAQRFYMGATAIDTNIGADNVHMSNTGYGGAVNQATRQAHDWAWVRGVSGAGRFGATLVSLVRDDSTHVTATFSVPSWAVSAATANVGTDKRAGMHFFSAISTNPITADNHAAELTPTAIGTPSAIASNQFTVQWTFASLPANVYMTAGLGTMATNPDATIAVGSINSLGPSILVDYGDAGVGTTIFNPPCEFLVTAGAAGPDILGPV